MKLRLVLAGTVCLAAGLSGHLASAQEVRDEVISTGTRAGTAYDPYDYGYPPPLGYDEKCDPVLDGGCEGDVGYDYGGGYGVDEDTSDTTTPIDVVLSTGIRRTTLLADFVEWCSSSEEHGAICLLDDGFDRFLDDLYSAPDILTDEDQRQIDELRRSLTLHNQETRPECMYDYSTLEGTLSGGTCSIALGLLTSGTGGWGIVGGATVCGAFGLADSEQARERQIEHCGYLPPPPPR